MSDFISGLILGLFCGGMLVAMAFTLAIIYRIQKNKKGETHGK